MFILKKIKKILGYNWKQCNENKCLVEFNFIKRKYELEINHLHDKVYYTNWYYFENDVKVNGMKNLLFCSANKLSDKIYHIVNKYFIKYNLDGIVFKIKKDECGNFYTDGVLDERFYKKYNLDFEYVNDDIFIFKTIKTFNINKEFYINKINELYTNK